MSEWGIIDWAGMAFIVFLLLVLIIALIEWWYLRPTHTDEE